MSNLARSLDRTLSVSPAQTQLEQDVRKKWPNLADALFGAAPVDGVGPALPSCSIILFVEGERLKYVLTPQGSDKVAFGTISEPLQGFCGLEASLEAGDFGWRQKKGKR